MIKIVPFTDTQMGSTVLIFGAEIPMYIDNKDKIGAWYEVEELSGDLLSVKNKKWENGRAIDYLERGNKCKQLAIIKDGKTTILRSISLCEAAHKCILVEKPKRFWQIKKYMLWIEAQYKLKNIETIILGIPKDSI